MPAGRKKAFLTKLTDVSATDKEGVGTVREEGFAEYIYLKGVASVAAGSPVTFDASYAATLLPTGTTPAGPVAIANAAITASKYGWFMIRGSRTVKCKASASKNAVVFNDKLTAGQIDTVDSGNNKIAGITIKSSVSASSTLTTCIISYPYVVE
jgi:hypothetical protein